jgi:hypothetical protein
MWSDLNGHDEAVRLGARLYAEKLAKIHWATPDEERAAFEYSVGMRTRRAALLIV